MTTVARTAPGTQRCQYSSSPPAPVSFPSSCFTRGSLRVEAEGAVCGGDPVDREAERGLAERHLVVGEVPGGVERRAQALAHAGVRLVGRPREPLGALHG